MSATSNAPISVSPSYKDKRVLVTGAGGFIGSALVNRLLTHDADVFAVVGPRGSDWRLTDYLDRVTIFRGDLLDRAVAERVMQEARPDVVFNVATTVNTERTLAHAEHTLDNTYGIAESVALAAVDAGVKRFVQFGTIEEYGTLSAPFSEEMREEPVSPYSLGKVLATHLVLAIGRHAPMEVAVVRPAATFGPSQGFGMLIPNIIKSAIEREDFDMNPGEQLRDFIYIDDLVDATLLIGERPEAKGEIFNIGNGAGMPLRGVSDRVNELMGTPIRINYGAHPYRPLDDKPFYMDCSKAEQLLGWRPKYGMQGLEKTVSWYREHYRDIR